MKIFSVAAVLVVLLAGCSEMSATDTSVKSATSFKQLDVKPVHPQPEMVHLLSTWTYNDPPGTLGDWMIEPQLRAHGATPAPSGSIPDIRVETIQGKAESLLWVRYRNREHFLRGNGNPDYDAQVMKIILDMAIVRLGEMHQEIVRKLGPKLK